MRIKKCVIISVCLVLSGAVQVWAGAWTLPQNGWYMEEGVTYFSSDKEFNETKESVKKFDNGIYTSITSKTYIEYGLVDRLNLIFTLPYTSAHYVDDYINIDNAGFQDLLLGVKWRWLQDPVVVSFGLSGETPMGYDRTKAPTLGTGRSNVEGRVFVSKSFFHVPKKLDVPGWSRLAVSLELAKDRSHAVYLIDAMLFVTNWAYLKGTWGGQDDLPTHHNGEDIAKWNLSLGLTSMGSNAIMRTGTDQTFSLSIGFGQVYQGRNTGRGSEMTVSISYVF